MDLKPLQIITTIGPASLSAETIKSLHSAGATSFRINLSHSNPELLKEYYDVLTQSGVIPSLDTQGAQVRVYKHAEKVSFFEGETMKISEPSSPMANNCDLLLNHAEIFPQLQPGDEMRIDFNGLVIRIDEIDLSNNVLSTSILNKGYLGINKAVDIIGKKLTLNPLTRFDIEAITQYSSKIKSLFLSFVNCADDIRYARNLINSPNLNARCPEIISKIETLSGIDNLESIIKESDAILIDRGDLSREISISKVPSATRAIIQTCRAYGLPCFVATNILDSMITDSLPSRAEVSDLYNLFSMGISGIVLAAEVAIGKHPVESVHVVKYMNEVFRDEENSTFTLSSTPEKNVNLPKSLRNWL